MRNKKKPLLFILAALCCLNVMAVSAAASQVPEITENSIVSPQAEEREWIYRIYEGKYQKRLWSLTYGYWLTDWIDCVV